MPSAPTTSTQLVDLIRRSGIVPPEKLAAVSDLALPANPQKAAAALVAHGMMTKFQASQLLAGRHKGFRIGPYTILDMLGRGGMGAVYLAEHCALHRKVAVKVLVPGKNEDQKLAQVRFQREARSVAALDHPNIVRIFDVSQYNGVPYLVMEYVEGETLQARIDRAGPFPFPTAIEYAAQAAAGLQHAHEKGFVHRDIKPGNLMLDLTGTVKILDMGLARSVGSAGDKVTEQLDHGEVVGTADFIAPEQAINNTIVDIRADIYSLGATLFSLINGKPPFEGNTTQKLLQHQLRSAPTLASVDATLPVGLSEVVEKMLAKKAADRYQTPAEAIAALNPWMPPSARILVGLSRTSLAVDEELQATLSGIHRKGSVAQMPGLADSSDLLVFTALESGRDTAAMMSAKTSRETKPLSPGQLPRSRKRLLMGVAAAAVLAAAAAGGWLVFGKDRKPVVDETPAAVSQSPQALRPADADAGHTAAPAAEKVLFQLYAAELPEFRTTTLGAEAQSGDSLPRVTGVSFGADQRDVVASWVAGPLDGAKAIGFAPLAGGPPARLAIDLELTAGSKAAPNQRVRIRVVYRTTGAGQGRVSLESDAGYATVPLPPSTGEWRTVELTAARGGKPVRGVIEALEPGAANMVYIRSITVAAGGRN